MIHKTTNNSGLNIRWSPSFKPGSGNWFYHGWGGQSLASHRKRIGRLRQGRVSWLRPACCHVTDCRFVSLRILIFSNDSNEDCSQMYVGMHVTMSVKKNNHVNLSRNKEITRPSQRARRRNSAPVSMETQNVNKPNRTDF